MAVGSPYQINCEPSAVGSSLGDLSRCKDVTATRCEGSHCTLIWSTHHLDPMQKPSRFTMARNEIMSLRDRELHDAEQDAPNLAQSDSRQRVLTRRRVCVLVGSAISQLPIWGSHAIYCGHGSVYLQKQALQ